MLGTAVYFTSTGDSGSTWTAAGTAFTDYNNQSSYGTSNLAAPGTIYRIFINVKVCDSSVQIEDNCTAYGSNYKPEGLIQQYSAKLRYSAFGYFNHSGNRDGGVMRARMKYVAIDLLSDKLDSQIRKHKEKLTDHHRAEAQTRKTGT